ncbi:Hint domain-containing protein [Marinovum sp.]|uniref:Hint domain-containing protein n=1 Tax=Marinovum sp. TaxID=2024839 RepID=UPI002B26C4B6|nr:Hint domain-containing protein [Marinovum sp.]
MAQESFSVYYEVQGMGAGATHGPAQSNPTTLVELASDGDGVNGNTDPNQDIDWSSSGFTGPFVYIGLSGNGDPIIEDQNSFARFVVSNNNGLEGSNVNPDTSASYSYCFAAGTLIATPDGDRAVETLCIGQDILTASGKTVAVKWLGRQTIRKFLNGARIQPVRIRKGALGDGLPKRPLVVTGDHGLVIDGLVINAAALVNGTTINWVPLAELGDSVTYYHVETENHDVILAEGAPAETFIDYLDRRAFDNYSEYLELYGAEQVIREMPMPRISAARMVPSSLRARLGLSMGDEAQPRKRTG